MSGSAFGRHVDEGNDRERREFAEFNKDVRTNLVPKLRDSAIVAALISPASTGPTWDAKQAVEIGATLLMGKPLVLLVEPGSHVPDGLVRAADRIVEGDLKGDPDGTVQRLTDAQQDVLRERGEL